MKMRSQILLNRTESAGFGIWIIQSLWDFAREFCMHISIAETNHAPKDQTWIHRSRRVSGYRLALLLLFYLRMTLGRTGILDIV